jgi:CubicO group peptidase (beta-lactamase class C family)
MKKDAVFWIASMTKSINGTALMMLVEEGKVTLDEPAAKWLPGLAKLKMKDGSAPKTAITLRMLLSHTAGIAFPPRKADDGAVSLKQYVDRLLAAPLAFEPGSDYEYGFGPTVAGRLLEVVTGKPYEVFLKERLFEPLGMVDTMFHPDEARRARIAQTYKLDEETKELVVSYNPFFTSSAAVKRMVEPAGGLFSTAADMGRFYAMVANGGELDGKRILSEKGVKEMTTPVSAGGKPITYGLGWQCCTEANAKMSPLGVGTFGHGGAFGTNGWVDLERKIATVFLVQNVLVPAGGKPKEVFQRMVSEAAGR